MKAGQLRRALRAGHIVVGVLLGIYVYSPLHADPLLTDIIRYLGIPAAQILQNQREADIRYLWPAC
jgi:hypothetical protein